VRGEPPAVRYDRDGPVVVITFDRPARRNAMGYAMLAEFTDAVDRAGQDREVRAVIVTGAGGAFCAGTDLSDLASTPTGERASRAPRRDTANWLLVSCPKPVIGAVDGPAVGMGAEFATQCDVRVASTTARFAWNFVLRGLIPDTGAGTFLLPRLIGSTEALRLLYSGEFLSAADALRVGFVSAVVEPSGLLEAARAEAERFVAGSPFAIERTRRLFYAAMGADVAAHLASTGAALGECFRSDDHREGVAAFLEKRAPQFSGT